MVHFAQDVPSSQQIHPSFQHLLPIEPETVHQTHQSLNIVFTDVADAIPHQQLPRTKRLEGQSWTGTASPRSIQGHPASEPKRK